MALLNRLATLLLLLTAAPAWAAQDIQLQEQEIKAGLVYNFLKYTNWPDSQRAPITVCIFGSDPFAGFLGPMAGRSVNQREITLRRLREVNEAEVCQLLFVNAEERHRWPKFQKFLEGKSVLTVSDFSGFAASGGMIEFGHKDNRINAVMNMRAMTTAGLQVQERLLRLVTVMQEAAP